MIEILEFVFRGFWTWLGFVILLAVFGQSLNGIFTFVKTTITKPEKKVEKKPEKKGE